MVNFNEMFGIETISDDAETSDGYVTGVQAAAKVHELILADYSEKSRAFREGLMEGLRDAL